MNPDIIEIFQRLKNATEKRVCKLILQGYTMKEIAIDLKRSRWYVWRILKGIKKRMQQK